MIRNAGRQPLTPDDTDLPETELARLAPGEREVLSLFGEGHTAKSVASLTGLSVAAVNERLRSARRKTGFASSRELARALRLQENRDEKIGLADAAPMPSGSSGTKPVLKSGRIVMTAIVAALVAGTALFLSQPAQEPKASRSPADALLGGLVAHSPDLPALHERVRTEPRDEGWAQSAEAALRSRYAQVPDLLAEGNRLRVVCAKSLCEVAGTFPADLGEEALADIVEALQSRVLFDDVEAAGFRHMGGGFSDAFVFYWGRKDQPD
ncbi:hypothetical protein I5E68_10700 [Novosphingobium sp. YJ-S2-02]|uniref:HTH luxR-type domain-containing protein n=1 Tax=Novosphingobium aureum TaxID=2792964 RepID=A0A931HCS2_9SPHN|nr:sigma factor-like helix-turn-helix DNA-binding protein [Novosphingobium aureum]MBH0113417.1 hypothetical protein [Novosphingobium aureum]